MFLLLWLLVFCRVAIIFYNILNLELIQFSNLDIQNIKKFVDHPFRSECIDNAIKEAISENKNLSLYPLIIAADECWRPWNIAQRFVVNAICDNRDETGVVYFTFTRPHTHCIKGLKNKAKNICKTNYGEMFFKNLYIIDCFSPLSLKSPGKRKELIIKELKFIIDCFFPISLLTSSWTEKVVNKGKDYFYLMEDPRNPHSLNKCYETALSCLQAEGCTRICVVYDALSDFLSFTDEQIAIQYLRHNMFLEEINNISSVYIYRLNTVQNKFFDEYITWFANCVLYFESKDGKPTMRTRGLFLDPRCFETDYEMSSIPESSDLCKRILSKFLGKK
jgi:hypothetical protein